MGTPLDSFPINISSSAPQYSQLKKKKKKERKRGREGGRGKEKRRRGREAAKPCFGQASIYPNPKDKS